MSWRLTGDYFRGNLSRRPPPKALVRLELRQILQPGVNLSDVRFNLTAGGVMQVFVIGGHLPECLSIYLSFHLLLIFEKKLFFLIACIFDFEFNLLCRLFFFTFKLTKKIIII